MSWPRTELPQWLWFWLPLLFCGVQFPIRASGWGTYRVWMGSEAGPIENLTFAACLIGLGAGILILAQRSRLPDRSAVAWVATITAGCLYFGGEEISWGQQLFDWGSPDVFRKHNDQAETNLHNLHGLGRYLDQFPRMALMIAAVVGGIVAPLSRRLRGKPDGWFWPTLVCTPVAVIAVTLRAPEWITGQRREALPQWLQIGYGELEELYLAAFLMLYLLSLRRRLAPAAPAGG